MQWRSSPVGHMCCRQRVGRTHRNCNWSLTNYKRGRRPAPHPPTQRRRRSTFPSHHDQPTQTTPTRSPSPLQPPSRRESPAVPPWLASPAPDRATPTWRIAGDGSPVEASPGSCATPSHARTAALASRPTQLPDYPTPKPKNVQKLSARTRHRYEFGEVFTLPVYPKTGGRRPARLQLRPVPQCCPTIAKIPAITKQTPTAK